MKQTLFKRLLMAFVMVTCTGLFTANAQITETFTNMATLTTTGGWVATNLSSPLGTTNWRQGDNTTLAGAFSSFDNFDGTNLDYALADYNSGSLTATISNWLITPNITTMSNGDTIRFYTRTVTYGTTQWPDNLQVRLSLNGGSANVGTTATSVGDFTTLLGEINPSLLQNTYPQVWTQYQVILAGLPAGNNSGRIAFRYFVTNGGPNGTNSVGIGLDLFQFRELAAGGGNTITVGAVTGNPFCPSESISIPYTKTGTFNAGNVFTAQLSDKFGSFTTPTTLGTLTSVNNGTITGTVPAGITVGGSYKIRVVGSNPATTSAATANFAANPSAASITAAGPTTICNGGSVTLNAGPYDRFYGWDALTATPLFGRFNASTPGTFNQIDTFTAGDYYQGDIGANGELYMIDLNLGTLIRVNLNTFARTFVGTAVGTVGHFWTGLAYNPANSTMYAISTDGAGSTSLYTINQTTAAATLIGTLPTPGLLPLSMAINNTGQAYIIELNGNNLYSVNLTTGIPALVGSLGINPAFAQDMDFDPVSNVLYWAAYDSTTSTAQLRTINTATGNSTLIGNLAGGNVSEIVAFAIAGNPTYAWSNGATTSSITVSAANTYTLTVTNGAGCTATASQAVTVGTVTPGITPSNPNVCAGPVTLTASGGGTYLWSTGATSSSISVSNAGTVSVTVTAANGCTASTSVNVTSGSVTTPTITPNGPTTFCQGGSVQLTASGGTSYVWSTGATTASITVTTGGTYTVTATSGGCTASNSQLVTVNSTPSVSVTGPNTVCSGSSITLTGNGASTYLWSTGSTNSSISVTAGGTYSVTGTSNGCTASGSQTVSLGTVNAQISPSNPNVCAGPTNITASGGGTYLWSTGATTAGITVSNAGSYTVTVTGTNGCTATQSVNVTSGTVPTITPGGATTFCQGGSVQLTAGGGTTYLWSTGATSAAITVTSSGTYTVTATSGSCTASQSQTVTVNNVPSISFTGGTTVCPGGTTQVTANGGTTYIWNTGATTASINVTSPNTYSVTATSNGCTASSSTTIAASSGPTATITPNGPTSYCSGQAATQLTASGGNSYIWNTGATSASITPTTSGSYTVTVTDASNCTGSTTQSLTINPTPTAAIQAGGSTTFCQGGSILLTASGGNSYSWSSGATSAAITVTAGGTYSVTVTGNGGCTASTSQVVNVNPAPTATINVAGNTTYCSNENPAVLTANGGGTYTWNTGAVTQSISPTTSGNYVVTVTDGNNCTASATQSITVNNAPTATITPSGPTSFCPGGSVTLTASGGSQFLWSDGSTTTGVTVSAGGVYSVTVTSPNGCTATTSQTVNVNSNPTTTITPSGATNFCQGGSVTLTAGLGTAYAWSSGGTTATITASTSGSYSVTVTIAAGCSATASQLVVVNPAPLASINTTSTQVCQGGSVTLTASGGATYSWSTGATTAAITISQPGTFDVTVTDANSCTAAVQQVISAAPAITVTGSVTAATSAGNNGGVNISVSGGTSPYTYSWSNAATTEDITAVSGGTYTVTVTDAQGCNGTQSFTVSIIDGINDVASTIEVTVFPNPNSGVFNINATLVEAKPLTVVITDITGKVILTQTTAKQTNYSLPIDLSNMADGIYLVKCFTDAENTVVKRIAINK